MISYSFGPVLKLPTAPEQLAKVARPAQFTALSCSRRGQVFTLIVLENSPFS